MGAVKEMLMELGDAGYIPMDTRHAERLMEATGETVVLDTVTIAVRGERITGLALSASRARRLLRNPMLPEEEREQLRWMMDVGGIPEQSPLQATADRLAAEILAAVAAGEDMPDDWHRMDAYADIGEPVAYEICRMVREELETAGIHP